MTQVSHSHPVKLETLLPFLDCRPPGPEWLMKLRYRALERLLELGIPTTHQEEWRFTDLAPIARTHFVPPQPLEHTEEQSGPVVGAAAAIQAGRRLVFVNGQFSRALSRLPALPAGAIVESLATQLQKAPGRLEPWLGRVNDGSSRPFPALNMAIFRDGAFVYLPRGTVLEEPIELLYLTSASSGDLTDQEHRPTASHTRNLLVLEAGSQVRIVETWAGIDAGKYFTNVLTEAVLEPGSRLEHYRFQNESRRSYHVGSLEVEQQRDSVLSTFVISAGASLARHEVRTALHGPGSECSMDGLYLTTGDQHVDHHTLIDHLSPHCSSRELYKGILSGRSRAVFNGRVLVRPDAVKSDARQTNKNVLLSDDATVNTLPQLEIYADDVKCAHGATVGQLDAEAIFYLRSRGLDEQTARGVLTEAFAREILERLPLPPLRAKMDEVLASWLTHEKREKR